MSLFKRLNVKSKLAIMVISVCIFLLLTNLQGIISLGSVNSNVETMFQRVLIPITEISEVENALMSIENASLCYIFTRGEERNQLRASIEDNLVLIQSVLDTYKDTFDLQGEGSGGVSTNEENGTLLGEEEKSFASLGASLPRLENVLSNLFDNMSFTYWQNNVAPVTAEAKAAIKTLIATNMERANILEQDSQQSYTGTRNLMIILLVIALAVAGVISIIISRNIASPLASISNMMMKAAEGDLTIIEKVDIEAKSKNEIQQLRIHFSRMIDALRKSVESILYTAGNMDETATNISSATNELSAGAQTQAGSAEELTATIEEMNASIQEVAENVQNTSDHTEKVLDAIRNLNSSLNNITDNIQVINSEAEAVSEAAGDMQAGIEASAEEAEKTETEVKETMERAHAGQKQAQKTVEEMIKINEDVQKLAQLIQGLGESAGKIGEIIDVIDDIAEQTNLLALNAAIEAARAGEHGRGFAVVAGAIGDLADKSQEATKDITGLIKSIQNEVSDAVETTERGRKQVEKGTVMVKEAGASFQDIYDAVTKATQSVELISNSISLQAEKSNNVATASDKIKNLIKDISNSLAEESTNTGKILELVEQVDELARNVAAATEEQSASTDEIVRAAENVSQIANENANASEKISTAISNLKELAQNLLSQVQQFKLPEKEIEQED